jgi:hypothetical protein
LRASVDPAALETLREELGARSASEAGGVETQA